MSLSHKEEHAVVPVSFDYDLISLSNTLAYSFEDGLAMASSILNAPFFITSLYDYVIIHSDFIKISDPVWDNIVETRFFNPAVAAANTNIHSTIVPNIGKMVYYSADKPTARQRLLAPYIAWMILQFGKNHFYISSFNNTLKSTVLVHLLNESFDIVDHSLNHSLPAEQLPQKLQVLAFFYNQTTDLYISEIAKICNRTEYIAVYLQKYRIFLFSPLTPAQKEALEEALSQYKIHAGLSYPFRSYKACHKHASQAIAALNEAIKQNRKPFLAQYEDLFALDMLHNFSSSMPLSAFRHPLLSFLDEYDRANHTEFYKTLMEYIENSGNTYETAAQLSMHRNTVSYRLRQVEKITGYDVQASSRRAALLYGMLVEHTLKKGNR